MNGAAKDNRKWDEHALLSALMDGGEPILIECGPIPASAFLDERHRTIFEAILSLSNEGEKAYTGDMVYSVLSEAGKVDKAGGFTYLSEVIQTNPIGTSAPWFAGKVLGAYRERLVAQKIGALVTGNGDPEALAKEIQEICQTMGADGDNGEPISSTVSRCLGQIEEATKHPGQLLGLSTGLVDLDDYLSGLQDDDMLTLAARPSVGKTALAIIVASHSAKQGIPVAFYSLEMSRASVVHRAIAAEAKVNSRYMRTGRIGAEQFERVCSKAAEVANWDLYIRDDVKAIRDIRSSAATMKQRHGVRLVVIDYLGLCYPPKGNYGSREQEVSAISREIKEIATSLHVPVMALSQLSRESERGAGREPRLSDLRDSGSLEQDSDVVMMLYAPKKNKDELDGQSTEKLLNVMIEKQRNGPTGVARTFFDKDTGFIGNWTSTREPWE